LPKSISSKQFDRERSYQISIALHNAWIPYAPEEFSGIKKALTKVGIPKAVCNRYPFIEEMFAGFDMEKP
jgi:hypothetical protein